MKQIDRHQVHAAEQAMKDAVDKLWMALHTAKSFIQETSFNSNTGRVLSEIESAIFQFQKARGDFD